MLPLFGGRSLEKLRFRLFELFRLLFRLALFAAEANIIQRIVLVGKAAVLFLLDADGEFEHVHRSDAALAVGRGDLRADLGHLFVNLAVIVVFVA